METLLKPKKTLSFKRKFFFSGMAFILIFFLFELGVRIFFDVQNQFIHNHMQLSKELGWRVKPNLTDTRTFKGYGKVTFSTAKDGFRVFGEVKTERTKIFVIGDSQTLARKVSDGQTYYHYLQDHADVEIFAYGGGGYGSLQEYMILDQYYNEIRPDMILWQFCANDIDNNSFALESSSRVNNNHMTRPYYQDGKIVYKYPHNSWIYRNLLRHSYLLKLLNIKTDILLADNLGAISDELRSEDRLFFKQAVDATFQIMRLAKERAKGTRLIAFSACGRSVSLQNKKFSEICNQLGIVYIDGILESLQRAEVSGSKVDGTPHDTHWNHVGHAIAGKSILEYFVQQGLVISTSHLSK